MVRRRVGSPDAYLQMAITQRQPPAGLIVHSDRGSQYASEAHRALLIRHGLTGRMSRKGNGWDSTVMERFFLNLKREGVWQNDYANHAEACRDITDYIVGFYNNVRLHSTLGYLPPTAYERKTAVQHTYRGVRYYLTTTADPNHPERQHMCEGTVTRLTPHTSI